MSPRKRSGATDDTAHDPVQDALAAHLEHLELGTTRPDVSHLTPAQQDELRDLLELLDDTQEVGFGRGIAQPAPEDGPRTDIGERVLATLRASLPADARVTPDPAATTLGIAGVQVVEGFVVGTFGGRVRVWLLAGEGVLDASDAWLRSAGRVFRVLPDTSAMALVERDMSCLVVQPEDCAPAIEVPRGSLVSQRYRRPIQAVGDALTAFLRELTPYWEPLGGIASGTARAIDAAPIAAEGAAAAIAEQVAAGGRARKTNPKRAALTALGDAHAEALAALTLAVNEGRAQPSTVDEELKRMAKGP